VAQLWGITQVIRQEVVQIVAGGQWQDAQLIA
jgi:hypothetical protein